MNLKSKWINIVAILYTGGLFLLLFFYLHISLLMFGEILLSGAIAGLISIAIRLSFFGCVNPTEWLVSYRFTLEGVSFGIMISLITIGTQIINHEPFRIVDFILALFIGIIFGILFQGLRASSKFKKRKEKLDKNQFEPIICCDTAHLTNTEGERIIGLLFLNRNRLAFYSAEKDRVLVDAPLSEIRPDIHRFKYFPLPRGIKLPGPQNTISLKFPWYWLNKIKKFKNNSPAIE